MQISDQSLHHRSSYNPFILTILDVPIDNSRSVSIDFEIQNSCLVHGFAGFFRTVLYKDLFLSKSTDKFLNGSNHFMILIQICLISCVFRHSSGRPLRWNVQLVPNLFPSSSKLFFQLKLPYSSDSPQTLLR